MRWLVITLVVIAALVAVMVAGPQIIGDKGYVLITLGDKAVEMTVVSLAISLIALAIAWWIVKQFIRWIFSLFKGSHNWFGSYGDRKRRRAFYRGLQALAEGELLEAKRALQRTTDGDFDGVNYLAAAQVARALNEPDRMRKLLEHAADYKHSKVAATLVLARLEIETNNPEAALKHIDALEEKDQKHPQAVRLRAEALARTGQWQTLQHNLNEWKRPLGDDYVMWSERIAKGKFAEIASKQGANQLKLYWEELPRKLRHDDAYRAAYVKQLLEQGMHSDAQTCLIEWQKKGPHPLLLPLFKEINLPNASPSIQAIESWIKQDDKNASLYSALGHVAFNSDDLVLAEKALLKSIKLSENREDLTTLARLYEQRNDDNQALLFYKQSMEVQ
ncbi:MAG TPA: heme biosynthesis protein [Oceanospirillales bacterium]|nr:heme biosynthesis protein [Oceanospirillales bacterium]